MLLYNSLLQMPFGMSVSLTPLSVRPQVRCVWGSGPKLLQKGSSLMTPHIRMVWPTVVVCLWKSTLILRTHKQRNCPIFLYLVIIKTNKASLLFTVVRYFIKCFLIIYYNNNLIIHFCEFSSIKLKTLKKFDAHKVTIP